MNPITRNAPSADPAGNGSLEEYQRQAVDQYSKHFFIDL